MTAEKLGFKQQVRRGINLAVAPEAVVDLTLDIGNIADQITVVEEAPLVNTAMEWDRYCSARVPLHASDWFKYLRDRRCQSIRHTELESKLYG